MSGLPEVGDTVRWTAPVSVAESEERYTVVEVNGDRGFMRLQGCDWPIVPVTLVRWSDVEVVRAPGSVWHDDHEGWLLQTATGHVEAYDTEAEARAAAGRV